MVLQRAKSGDGLERFQLVVDGASLKVINSFLRMGDLHSEARRFGHLPCTCKGITSVELLEESREPLFRPPGCEIDFDFDVECLFVLLFLSGHDEAWLGCHVLLEAATCRMTTVTCQAPG